MPRVTQQKPPKRKKKATKTRKPQPRKKGGSVLERIQPLGFSDERRLKLSLYGRSGTGKTTLWSTFPGKILALVASGGMSPGEGLSIDTPENRKRIETVVLEQPNEIEEVVNYQRTQGAYETVVLDHATGLQELVLAEVLGIAPEDVPVQMSWGVASQQQWGQVAMHMKTWLRHLLNLENCHVVIVAQEREFEANDDDELITPYVGSALTPSVTGWLNFAADYICSTFIRRQKKTRTVTIGKGAKAKQVERSEFVGGVEYCLRVAPDPVFTTKFRKPKGGEVDVEPIVDPDFEKIMALIKS